MVFLALYLFLLASAQTCQLFENDLMATRKRSKEAISQREFDLLSIFISDVIQLKGRYLKNTILN